MKSAPCEMGHDLRCSSDIALIIVHNFYIQKKFRLLTLQSMQFVFDYKKEQPWEIE